MASDLLSVSSFSSAHEKMNSNDGVPQAAGPKKLNLNVKRQDSLMSVNSMVSCDFEEEKHCSANVG